MYNNTITLFNRLSNRTTGDTWYPTVITGVDVNLDRAQIVATMGAESTDSVSLHIKYTKDNDGNIVVGGKIYKLPKEWAHLSTEDLPDHITFKSGNDFDFFYVGEWSDTAPIADSSYRNGFYDHMNKNYDNVFSITMASGAYDLIQHFELLGK